MIEKRLQELSEKLHNKHKNLATDNKNIIDFLFQVADKAFWQIRDNLSGKYGFKVYINVDYISRVIRIEIGSGFLNGSRLEGFLYELHLNLSEELLRTVKIGHKEYTEKIFNNYALNKIRIEDILGDFLDIYEQEQLAI